MAWKANATLKSLRVFLILSRRKWSANVELLSSRYKTTLDGKKVSPLASPVRVLLSRGQGAPPPSFQFKQNVDLLQDPHFDLRWWTGQIPQKLPRTQVSGDHLQLSYTGAYFSNRRLSESHLYTLRSLLLGTVHDLGFWMVFDNQTQKVPMAFGKPFLRTHSTLFILFRRVCVLISV